MTTLTAARMSLDEFRQLPDDPEIDRMLLGGQLVEEPMTYRNRWHANLESRVAGLLYQWKAQTNVTGDIFSGEVGCELAHVETFVGIDTAYFSKEVLDAQERDSSYIIGTPVLAVEILSPSDIQKNITRKVRLYLDAGVRQVWIIDPELKTLTIHRPDARPELFAKGQAVTGGDDLSGLTFEMDALFD